MKAVVPALFLGLFAAACSGNTASKVNSEETIINYKKTLAPEMRVTMLQGQLYDALYRYAQSAEGQLVRDKLTLDQEGVKIEENGQSLSCKEEQNGMLTVNTYRCDFALASEEIAQVQDSKSLPGILYKAIANATNNPGATIVALADELNNSITCVNDNAGFGCVLSLATAVDAE